jgi:uncharacterized protein (DUF1684 family)
MEPVRRLAPTIFLLLLVAGCSSGPEDYAGRITSERQQKDTMFRKGGKDSPVKPGEVDKFLPLSYFPVDESYAVPAQLEPAPERVAVTMPTSTGQLRTVERVGMLKFNLKGQPLKLTAFLEQGSRALFVPFSDLTSGTETYQAGRYMNLEPSPSGIYIVDFNVAYNPYCYYNAEYDCPLPPAENRLSVPIRAGERMRSADVTIDR